MEKVDMPMSDPEFLKKREEALKVANPNTQELVEGPGGSMIRPEDMTPEEKEALIENLREKGHTH